jgi:tetratricopeptide (TPR) repeat protein
MLVLAQTREGQGDSRDAYNLYQELRRLSPQSSIGKTAKEHVEKLRVAAPSQFGLHDEQDYLQEIRLLQKEGEDANVDELSVQFNSKFPDSALRSEVLMLLAGIYKKQGRINDAAVTWQEIVDRYPSGALAPVAMSNWATLLWNKDRNEEAQALFTRLTQQYPRHEKAAEAWYAIGRIWQDRKDETRAATAYDLATLFAGSQLAREVVGGRAGWPTKAQTSTGRASSRLGAICLNTAEGERAYCRPSLRAA